MRSRLAVVLASVLLLAGCASSDVDPGATENSTPSAAAPELSGELTIYAAASLKTAFDELETLFEAQHPSLEVLPVVYDGSSTLATQLIEGAPADVFASADEKNLQKVVDAGLAADSQLFATNTLVVALPAGNPGDVEDLSDLADDSVSVVVCASEVPCGAASATLLSNAGLAVTPVSLEQNVTAVLTKVAAGEADAGLVYVTDVKGRTDIETIVPEGAAAVVNHYPIAALSEAANPLAAQAFTEFVLSERAQAVLAGLGFGAP